LIAPNVSRKYAIAKSEHRKCVNRQQTGFITEKLATHLEDASDDGKLYNPAGCPPH